MGRCRADTLMPKGDRRGMKSFARPLHRILGVWLVVLGSGFFSAVGQCATVAVLYPDVRDPYLSVFLAIMQGIESRVSGAVRRYALADGFDPDQMHNWLRRHKADAIIALGQRGLQAAKTVDPGLERPVVVGALLLTPKLNPDGFTGISLAADPGRLFAQLKSLRPAVRRVFAVYNSEENGWLMDLAAEAARTHDLELVAHEAWDLRTAVRRYDEILKEANSETDALWLPLDSTTVDERVVLPMILEAAWDRHLTVFSVNPAHAQRGVLFSMYPDNFALGQRLADIVLEKLRCEWRGPQGVLPLRDLRVAVNLRTAAHLGLRFTPAQQRKFDLVFPSP